MEYFICLNPPKPLELQLKALKNELKERFEQPPRVFDRNDIMLMKVVIGEKYEPFLKWVLNNISLEQSPFDLQVNGFKFRYSSFLAFVNFSDRSDLSYLFRVIKKRIELILKHKFPSNESFDPFIFMAQARDPDQFALVERFLMMKTLRAHFSVNRIGLYKKDEKSGRLIDLDHFDFRFRQFEIFDT
jgi:hypothetical protein